MSRISVSLGLVAEQFASGITRARNYVKEFGKELKGSIFAGITAAVLAQKAISWLTDTFKEYARLADTAQGLGVNVEELQRLAFAGKQVGVGMEQTARIMQRINQMLAKGMADPRYAEKLAKVGIETGKLRNHGYTATSALLEIARATSKVNEPMEKLSILMQYFDSRTARGLMPLLANGADALDRVSKSAPVASKSMVQSIDEMDDRLELSKQWWSVIGVYALDIVTRLAAALALVAISAFSVGAVIGAVIVEISIGVGLLIGLIGDLLAMFTGDFDFSNFKAFWSAGGELNKEMGKVFSGIGEAYGTTWDVMVSGSGAERSGGMGKKLNRARADAMADAAEEGMTAGPAKAYAGSGLAGVGGGSGNFALADSNVEREQLRTLQTIADNTKSTSTNTAATKDAPKLK